MTIKISQLANLTVVQANTIVPVVSNITGTLTTVKSNVQQLQDYIVANGVSANITALYTNAAIQSDLIIRINANVILANLNLKTYVDGQITAANAGVTASNVGIIGYIGLGNTTMKSYVDGQITSANTGASLSNTSMKSYVDGQITSANIGMKGYVDNQTYSNVKVAQYLPTYRGNIADVVTSGNLAVFGNTFINNSYIPEFANSTGAVGQIVWGSNYIYVCTDVDTWKRANISTW
jgi:hypothetical protein